MKRITSSRPTEEESRLFEEFWKEYPRGRMGRKDRAKKAFLLELRRGAPSEVLIAAAKRYAVWMRYEVMRRGDEAFTYGYYASSFLSGQLYFDKWPAPFDPAEEIDPTDVAAMDEFLKRVER